MVSAGRIPSPIARSPCTRREKAFIPCGRDATLLENPTESTRYLSACGDTAWPRWFEGILTGSTTHGSKEKDL